MGLFTSIFGGASADTSDYKKAIDAFKSIATPELSALQVQLDKYVQAGKLSPEAAESVLLNSNAFNDIKTDPQYVGAQKQALTQLQNIATQGGLTATDKAQLNDIAIEQNTVAKGRNEAIMQNAQERGIGGSGLELTSRLLNEQEAANRASTQGTQVAANAEQRALQALQSAGTLGGQMEAQQYGEQANKATAQNAIDKFNAETQQNTNLLNVQNKNAAEAANLAATQDIANKNTGTANVEKTANAAAVQQDYANKMGKASNIANEYNQMAGAKNAVNAQNQAADVGFTSGLIGAGATALTAGMSGSAGGALSSTTPSYAAPADYYKKQIGNYAEGGKVEDDKMIEFPKDEMIEEHERLIPQLEGDEKNKQSKELDEIRDMTEGGFVPGKAKVKGDSPKNDVVPAMLSPGEVVVPRSAANDEEDYDKFMKEVKFQPMNCGGKMGYAQGGPVPPPAVPVKLTPPAAPPVASVLPPSAPKPSVPPPVVPPAKDDTIERALKSLQFRVTNLEGGK
jgi:hypothetical protein